MAHTFTPKKNGWNHLYAFDDSTLLRSAGTAITSDTNGSAVTTGFSPGEILTLLADIDTCDYTDGDETYFIWLQYSTDGTNYYDIQGGCIRPALTGASPNAYDVGLYSAHCMIPKGTTKIRYRVDGEGTSWSIDLSIRLGIAP